MMRVFSDTTSCFYLFSNSVMMVDTFSALQIFCICSHICQRILILLIIQAISAGLSKDNFFPLNPIMHM